MTPSYLNSSFLIESSIIEDHDIDLRHQHQFFSPSFQHQHDANSSSSSHHPFHFYFNPTQDQAGCNYHTELVNRPQQQLDRENGSGFAFGGSYDLYQVENKVEKGLKISVGSNKEGKQEIVGDEEASNKSAKWMTSKARMMHNKMKKSDHKKGGGEREDSQKLPFNNNNYSLGSNNDHESNCSSYNNNNTTIRVCADCNTTKTPLWRSGPKGPKSLCNACGIRQRKARRALAAAAATANAIPLSSTQTTPSPITTTTTTTTKVKIKVKNHQKEKSKNNYGINENSTVPFKKRCKLTTTITTNASLAVGSSSSDQEQAPVNRFEGFLINLRNKLAFDHVSPQDEKEAAILLMALSCGLVHG